MKAKTFSEDQNKKIEAVQEMDRLDAEIKQLEASHKYEQAAVVFERYAALVIIINLRWPELFK